MEKTRNCRICETPRTEEEFYTNDKTNRCKACEQARKRRERKKRSHVDIDRRSRLKKEYGISLEDYQRMFDRQNGLCAICNQPEKMNRSSLCIDHDHKTGIIRGLLCHACNVALGHFEDDINTLNKAIKYLEDGKYSITNTEDIEVGRRLG